MKLFHPIHTTASVAFLLASAASAQLIISGNDNTIDLASGTAVVVSDPAPDTLTVLDFSSFPPAVRQIEDIPNSVIGQPSNLDITPDGLLALVAESVRVDPSNPTAFVPASRVHIVDLSTEPARGIGSIETGRQPSGLSITPDGSLALVANRADGSISVLSINGTEIKETQRVQVCEPAENLADIAIFPDGTRALASVHTGGYLSELSIDNGDVSVTGRRYSVYGKPYRVVVTPDGDLGISGGIGFGSGPDRDAISIVDLRADPPRVVDHIAVGSVPESIEISPDGQLLAVVTMEGSNLPAESPFRTEHGKLSILRREGTTFIAQQEFPIARIPQGVAFTSDGAYLVVPGNPDQVLQIFSIKDGRVRETRERIDTPGMPASIRASK